MQIATSPMKTDAVPRTSRLQPSVNSRYDAVEITLHWATALLVITLYFLDQAWARKYSVITSRAVAQCSVISTASYREFTLGCSREVRGTASVFIGDVAICMAIASYVAVHNMERAG